MDKILRCNKRFYSSFVRRHVGLDNQDIKKMLNLCNSKSLDDLVKEINPIAKKINYKNTNISEHDNFKNLRKIMNKNNNNINMIGMGFYNTYTPFPIKRHILENPKWYTPYTPYQAEISQGRLENQYNFQNIVKDLTKLKVSNASLLDEASSTGEAIDLCYNYHKKNKKTLIVSETINPTTIDLIKTRSRVLGLNLKIMDLTNRNLLTQINDDVFSIIFQYPDTFGDINIPNNIIDNAKEKNILTVAISDLLALTKIKPPGEIGVDISLGNSQRLGIPMWFGGPHPCFFAVSEKLLRFLPGRIIAKSIDSNDNLVYQLGLQTREQHIKKNKATSNICTSQSLLTNVVSLYCLYHGKEGILNIANDIFNKTNYLANSIDHKLIKNNYFFDTLTIQHKNTNNILDKLKEDNIIVRKINDESFSLSVDETTTLETINKLISTINSNSNNITPMEDKYIKAFDMKELERNTSFFDDKIYQKYNSETNLLRYIYKLSQKDFTLCEGMIPLGSCTMKLNSCSQLEPLSWESVMNSHPYSPKEFNKGYYELIEKVGDMLKNITGFNHVSFQSNSGSMGEYSGLLCIDKYHKINNDQERNICIVPKSAHGTNFASVTKSNLDLKIFDDNLFDDLNKFEDFLISLDNKLSSLMITYPNTNGVFQKNIKDINELIHKYGGLVYMDGANMNANVGLVFPSELKFDVCHLNLHKTFCIPHGGGGPGLGPILCNDKLKDFLPTNVIQDTNKDCSQSIGSITHSNFSNASLLTIPYMYISSMGYDGLQYASKIALLNSNYLKDCLKDHYKIIDVNDNNRVGHEFIVDVNQFSKYNITENDIAKRLIDYSFHPPTMSWPRKGVLMFEPTESESKEELDRLILSMIEIRKEIDEIIQSKVDSNNNVLKNSPHGLNGLSEWNYPYSIEKGFYPLPHLKESKFYPPISRVNNSYGDKELLGLLKKST